MFSYVRFFVIFVFISSDPIIKSTFGLTYIASITVIVIAQNSINKISFIMFANIILT